MQHRVNDTAVLDATVTALETQGWDAVKTGEREVEQGRLPVAELYLNMCQGSLAAEQLMPLECDGAVVVNRPSSALNCHRHRLVKRLGESTLAFPRTLILASSATLPLEQLDALSPDHHDVWIKRGDVHAERPEDVVATPRERVAEALRAFRSDVAAGAAGCAFSRPSRRVDQAGGRSRRAAGGRGRDAARAGRGSVAGVRSPRHPVGRAAGTRARSDREVLRCDGRALLPLVRLGCRIRRRAAEGGREPAQGAGVRGGGDPRA